MRRTLSDNYIRVYIFRSVYYRSRPAPSDGTHWQPNKETYRRNSGRSVTKLRRTVSRTFTVSNTPGSSV